jgi:uncharacterized phage protein (TIGR01671 family)
MDRKIKFRLWLEDRKIFDYTSSDRMIWEKGMPRLAFMVSCAAVDENYVIQQFTGLYDKKGNEIYEGDILKCPWNFSPNNYSFGEVVFWEGAFRLSKGEERDDDIKEFCPYDLYSDNDTPTRTYLWNKAEVISNVFKK